MAYIYYIRHGQASLFEDDYDNLSKKGIAQSKQLGEYFSKNRTRFDKVFIGPLKRHKQTFQNMNLNSDVELITLEGLREHNGPKMLKEILPFLIRDFPDIEQVFSVEPKDKKEKIKQHFRIYEKVMAKWAQDELKAYTKNYQSWEEFRQISEQAFTNIASLTNSNENVAVVTSGGPIASSLGNALHLNNAKTMELSWILYNCSVTKYQKGGQRLRLLQMNLTSAFTSPDMLTFI